MRLRKGGPATPPGTRKWRSYWHAPSAQGKRSRSEKSTTLAAGDQTIFRCPDSRYPDLLGDAHFLICPVNVFESLANLPHRRISPHAVNDKRHGIRVADVSVTTNHRLLRGSDLQRVETAADFIVIATLTQRPELLALMDGHRLIDIESRNLFFLDSEIVDAHCDLFSRFVVALE